MPRLRGAEQNSSRSSWVLPRYHGRLSEEYWLPFLHLQSSPLPWSVTPFDGIKMSTLASARLRSSGVRAGRCPHAINSTAWTTNWRS
jgi:hypothetical protein